MQYIKHIRIIDSHQQLLMGAYCYSAYLPKTLSEKSHN